MKNLVFSLITFVACSSLSAQSLQVSFDTPIPPMNTLDLNTTLDFLGNHVKNISAQSVDVRINRISNDVFLGHETYFCWEYCYDPSVSLSGSTGIAIAPDSTNSAFTFHINANGIEGCGQAVVHIFNKKNANDYVELVFNYCTPNGVVNGIANEIGAKQVLSTPQPNPSTDAALVKITLPRNTDNTYLTIQDVMGKEINRITVEQPNTEISIPTHEFSTGLYYLTLVAEGTTLATQKLMVK